MLVVGGGGADVEVDVVLVLVGVDALVDESDAEGVPSGGPGLGLP